MSMTVDLRSDTVTRPVPGMRRAIAEAEVGDDVFGDDPTVNALEERVARLFGTEAAVFVPSGTMANQIALAALTSPGDEVILDRQAHIFNYEVAATPALSGVQFNALDGDGGILSAEQIEPYIRPRNIHQPITRTVAVENTHNRGAGRVYPLEKMRGIRELADRHGLSVHLDGARLANAVVATGIDFATWASCADTVSMCFSKGLGAPVGSIVGGRTDVIEKARRKRKQFGGGMRQAGILAAAALYALDHHVERLSEDHEKAQRLGDAIRQTEGLELVCPPETNIVIFRVKIELATVDAFMSYLEENGVRAIAFGADRVRMVTHLDVTAEGVEHACDCIRRFRGR